MSFRTFAAAAVFAARGSGGQDRPHHLGDAELGTTIQGAGSSIGRYRGPQRGKEQKSSTAKWSGPGSANSVVVIALPKRARMIGTDPRNPCGPAVIKSTASKAEYMTAPDLRRIC